MAVQECSKRPEYYPQYMNACGRYWSECFCYCQNTYFPKPSEKCPKNALVLLHKARDWGEGLDASVWYNWNYYCSPKCKYIQIFPKMQVPGKAKTGNN